MSAQAHCFAQHSHLKHCAYSQAHGHSPLSKHSQHTVNPLIVLHVNPFLPSAISTVSVLFCSTDHCIGVTGNVNDTKSVPPSVRMPATVLL
ncbi:unnamed protein product [Staurois parvus]|uniref:Uncharacterized protein n=1 Tax=Staurois parvus TaxID=386267 RepID=A0ABN9HQC7_9NEOB|nr:unnamed protein product [Staurois parvus]